eukprot:gene9816-7708_t
MQAKQAPVARPVRAAGVRPARVRGVSVVRNAVEHEYSSRVAGDAWRVSEFVANYAHLPEWYPGVKKSYPLSPGEPIKVGTQFKVEQSIAGYKLMTTYQVAELVPEKKVVYISKSDLHTSTEQYIFMPDPNDKDNYTFVRYMSKIELREWKKALEPMLKLPMMENVTEMVLVDLQKLLNSIPMEKMTEGALVDLQKLLNSSTTPLRNIPRKPREKRTRGPMFGGEPSSNSNDENSFIGNLGKQVAGAAGKAAGQAAGAVFSKLFGGKKGSTSSADVLGYYKILGLDAEIRAALSDADVKAAFRKAAKTMHPDTVAASADAKVREAAEETFKKVQIAYTVLKDPITRSRYNAGEQIRPELQ